MVTLSTYRTDSVWRRFLAAFAPILMEVVRKNKLNAWISIVGSTSNNTASTINPPDFDCVCFAPLGQLNKHHLLMECNYDPRGAVYYRLRFTGTEEQRVRLEKFLTNNLSHLVRYSKYKEDPYSVPWFVLHEDKWYLSSDNIRTLQEGIGDIIGAERSETGAAATAVFPVEEKFLLDMYRKFQQRLTPKTATNRFFSKIVPMVVIPYFVKEYKNKSLDLDLVTLVNCQPDKATIERIKKEVGLPRKVEEHMRRKDGIYLSTKVDKMGVGNKMIDFCLAISHESILSKFKGCREVIVTIKDLLAVSNADYVDKTLPILWSNTPCYGSKEGYHADELTPEGQSDVASSSWVPKSYHFKTVMANLLKERHDAFCDELLDKETLLKETLRKTIQAYEDCYLPSFFDPRINLLLDLKALKEIDDRKRRGAIEAMKNILENHERLLQKCYRHPMALSRLIMGIVEEILDTNIIDWHQEHDLAPLFNLALKLIKLDYKDHSKERSVEANLTQLILAEASTVFALDMTIHAGRAVRRIIQFISYTYTANTLATIKNILFNNYKGDTNCAEGALGEAMDGFCRKAAIWKRRGTETFDQRKQEARESPLWVKAYRRGRREYRKLIRTYVRNEYFYRVLNYIVDLIR